MKYIVRFEDDSKVFGFTDEEAMKSYIYERLRREANEYASSNDLEIDEDISPAEAVFGSGTSYKIYSVEDLTASINQSNMDNEDKKALTKLLSKDKDGATINLDDYSDVYDILDDLDEIDTDIFVDEL